MYSMYCIQGKVVILTLTIGSIIRTFAFSPCDTFVIIATKLFKFSKK